ncbi:MAG: 50S ribosomal protein L6 [Leptonema sp. (in: bacteria)]
MSRIGKLPIEIPKEVEVKLQNQELTIKGPLGLLKQPIPDNIEIEILKDKIIVKRKSDFKKIKALHGLVRSLINNHIIGVTKGWTKRLQLVGVGYRANLRGKTLILSLGYSHDIEYPIPDGINLKVDQQVKIELTGIDKQKVGQVSAIIRNFKPPEPYKGKGIKYEEEEIRRKAGKAGKSGKGK